MLLTFPLFHLCARVLTTYTVFSSHFRVQGTEACGHYGHAINSPLLKKANCLWQKHRPVAWLTLCVSLRTAVLHHWTPFCISPEQEAGLYLEQLRLKVINGILYITIIKFNSSSLWEITKCYVLSKLEDQRLTLLWLSWVLLFWNLVRQLDHSDFISKIWPIHLAKLQWTAF